jgi:MFS family permease
MALLPPPEELPILPAILLVTGLALGNMCVLPMAMGLVLDFTAGRPAGAYYGLLASAGGLAVVIGNTALAPLYELAYTPSTTAPAAWLLLAISAAISATFIRRFVPPPPSAAGLRKGHQSARASQAAESP